MVCVSGYLGNQPCVDDMVWDDEKKSCVKESKTCPSTISHPSTGGQCVSDCYAMPTGDYQSCKTCEGYVFCSKDVLYDMPCAPPTVWDDEKKRCEYESSTCWPTTSHPSTGDRCVSDCSGMPNGDYQSCKTCKGYVFCSKDVLYDMPCAPPTVWDDVKKRCEFESSTCSPTASRPSTGDRCVSDCAGMPKGDYQSCKTCEGHVFCSEGALFEIPCAPTHPSGPPLVWDDVKKRCEYQSSTCSPSASRP